MLESMQAHNIVSQEEMVLLSLAITGLSEKNIRGEQTLKADVEIKNRTLYLGPIPVARLPSLSWGTRSLPALLPQ